MPAGRAWHHYLKPWGSNAGDVLWLHRCDADLYGWTISDMDNLRTIGGSQRQSVARDQIFIFDGHRGKARYRMTTRSEKQVEHTLNSPLLGAIDHVQLPVADTRQAVDWYTRYLGFEVTDVLQDDLAVVRLAAGPTLFLWRTRDQTTANFTKDGELMPVIGVSCNNISKLRSVLEAAGAQISYNAREGRRTFLKFLDPYGNMIVAHQEHDE